MPKLNRYTSSELRDKLAAEYVLGTLTPRVRKRLERLMTQGPSWWEYVEQWQQHFAAHNPAWDAGSDESAYVSPPPRIWRNILRSIDPRRDVKTAQSAHQRPTWLVPFGFTFSLFLGILISPYLTFKPSVPAETPVQPAAYLAMMSSSQEPNHFALVAYQGLKPGESTIRLQRNLREASLPSENAMVWMKDKDTGEIQRIGSLRAINDTRFMTPKEWRALKNSSELIVTANESPTSQVLYRGRCVELSDWNAI
ncbi:anti-sigma factor [Enterovibrio coralii]|uniref:Anti-sigma factor n=1 Tax=Enterovibrio coralii TaxID=294935 RepID=A0A135IA20_9GAMM|nr:hypothetical protein [Enterovibrio coralii]KXF82301.1 hypothetical protein ATN88_09025 [Enterovibrio coralii]